MENRSQYNENNLLRFVEKRLIFLLCSFFLCYALIAFKLFHVVLTSSPKGGGVSQYIAKPRADIVDKNGRVLATDIMVFSVYADPLVMVDPDEAAKLISNLCPYLDCKKLKKKFQSKNRFAWVLRKISPDLKEKIHNLGIPGIFFVQEIHRVYPQGSVASHILGHCDIDGNAKSGVEYSFEDRLKNNVKEPLKLTIDIRIQSIIREILYEGIQKHRADAGNVLLMDDQGRVIASVSYPDFHGDRFEASKSNNMFNRNFQGCFELGSSVKIINAAIALQTKTASLNTCYDARGSFKIGKYTVNDYKAKNRILSFTEAFIYSSNIAMIKMAMDFGVENQKRYFKELGLIDRPTLEIKEMGRSIIPCKWCNTKLMTMAYGYGFAVTPLTFLSAVATILNDGYKVKPTIIETNVVKEKQKRVIDRNVSLAIQEIMKKNIHDGTAKKGNVPGYDLLGKTGTRQKLVNGRYDLNYRDTCFITCLRGQKKKYFMLLQLDSPKIIEGNAAATAGVNAAPLSSDIIKIIAPLLNVRPNYDDQERQQAN